MTATDRPWYDDPDQISKRLAGLGDLHEVLSERHTAYYKRGEQLQDIVFLDHFGSDSCGNPARVELELVDEGRGQGQAPVPMRVRTQAHFQGLRVVFSFGSFPPTPESMCSECGEGWTLDNAHDSVRRDDSVETSSTYRHVRCDYLAREREMRAVYADIFRGAGLTTMLLEPYPNGYSNDALASSWCLARSVRGNILVGRRKRVFEIQWEDVIDHAPADRAAALNGNTMFEDLHVHISRGTTWVHAWSVADASSYLVRIAAAACIPMVPTLPGARV